MKIIKKLILLIIALALLFAGYVYINRTVVSTDEATSALKTDTCYKYYYSKLEGNTKSIYEKLYYVFLNRMTSIELKDTSRDEIDEAFKSVMYDHPELYYVNKTYHYIDFMDLYEVRITYNYSKEECTTYDKQLASIVEEVKDATENDNTIEKIKYVYNYVAENTEYKEENNDQDMISSLIDHKSVCAGYAKAYQYLLSQLGIDAAYLQGEAKESVVEGDTLGHAWLMLHILNDYYYSDVTWADVTTTDFEHTCYATFMLTSDQMLSMYTPEDYYEKSVSSTFDYYRMIHCYMDHYDESVLSYALRYTILNNRDICEIKCSSADVMNEVVSQLKTTQTLYTLLNKNGHSYSKASYVTRDTLNIVEIHFYN